MAVGNEQLEKVSQTFEVLLVIIVVCMVDNHPTRIDVAEHVFIISPLLVWHLSLIVLLLRSADSVSQIDVFDVFYDGGYQFIVDDLASLLAPPIFVEPLSPKLDRILQTLFWALASKNGCIRDFQSFLECSPDKFSDPLSKCFSVLGKTHDKRCEGVVKAMLVLFIQLPVVSNSDRAHFEKVSLDLFCWRLPKLEQDERV